ncbi:hypothetical protein OEZ86_010443 [Tetradesmus obliquus]|nr:hypothetical protein OEZ86_010443 [Tetradesmus obliquus]
MAQTPPTGHSDMAPELLGTFRLKTWHGKYVTALSNVFSLGAGVPNYPVVCTEWPFANWGNWQLYLLDNVKIALKSDHGRYMCAYGPDNGGHVINHSEAIGDREQYDLIHLKQDQMALRSHHSQLLWACPNHGLRSDGDTVAFWSDGKTLLHSGTCSVFTLQPVGDDAVSGMLHKVQDMLTVCQRAQKRKQQQKQQQEEQQQQQRQQSDGCSLTSSAQLEELKGQVQQQHSEIAGLRQKCEEQHAKLEEQQVKLQEQEVKLQEQREKLEEQHAKLEEQEVKLEEQREKLEEQREKLEEQREKLEEQQEKLEEQEVVTGYLLSTRGAAAAYAKPRAAGWLQYCESLSGFLQVM